MQSAYYGNLLPKDRYMDDLCDLQRQDSPVNHEEGKTRSIKTA